jgi:tripartite-type tricarboxylate transporter receptor subunit TctC
VVFLLDTNYCSEVKLSIGRTPVVPVLTAALLFFAHPAASENFPGKPVRVIVPYAAGGGTDTSARIVAQKLAEKWGQSVIVDNRSGAAGIIGTEIVANATPDGYTLLVAAGAHAINPSLYAKLPYNTMKDFASLALLVTGQNILVVNSALSATTVRELIALAKSRPGQLSFGSGGTGQTTFVAAALFNSMAGIEMIHIPYKGGAPAVADLIAGRISVMFGPIVLTLPHVKGGRVRALAVTGARRAKATPELPTIAESGLPGYEANEWFGMFAPAGTSGKLVESLNADVRSVLKMHDTQERLSALGAETADISAQDFAIFVGNEIAKWTKVIKDAKIQPE